MHHSGVRGRFGRRGAVEWRQRGVLARWIRGCRPLRVSPKMRAAMALWQSVSAAPTSLARPMAWPCGSQTRRGPFRAEPPAGMGHPARGLLEVEVIIPRGE
eukprot:scaffold5551_cov119-Isochrysis_galbana.AAC.7